MFLLWWATLMPLIIAVVLSVIAITTIVGILKLFLKPNSNRAESTPNIKSGDKKYASQTNFEIQHQYFAKRILNKKEYECLRNLESSIKVCNRLNNNEYYRLFVQVSLGEILGADDDDSFALVNAKRSDFVVVNKSGYPVAAIEYQGRGHHQGNAAERDRIKKQAFASANIPLIEIYEDSSWNEIQRQLRKILLAP